MPLRPLWQPVHRVAGYALLQLGVQLDEQLIGRGPALGGGRQCVPALVETHALVLEGQGQLGQQHRIDVGRRGHATRGGGRRHLLDIVRRLPFFLGITKFSARD